MSIDIEIEVKPEYILLTASGKYLFEELFEFITLLKREADRVRRNRALVDCRQFEGSMTEAERFEGGQYIAEVFGPHLKAALVMPKGQVTKMGELAAVNRGARLLVTECETEAVSWLIN